MKLSTALAIALGAALLLSAVGPPLPAADSVGVIVPPLPPQHARRRLTTGSELAEDLSDTVKYLEAGQAFFRAYQKGSHSVAENKAFLGFLEDYEAELQVAKKEAQALRTWVLERGSLDSVSTP